MTSRLTPLQESLYTHLLNSKEIKHAREGKQLDTLGAIRQLINICRYGVVTEYPLIILHGSLTP